MATRRSKVIPFLVILLCTSSATTSSFVTGTAGTAAICNTHQRQQHLKLRAGGVGGSSIGRRGSKSDDEERERQQQETTAKFGPDASSLFANVRIPAALFAGAAAGAAFAMPLAAADTLRVGLVKRVYALSMVGCLSSQLIAIVVSTLALEALSRRRHDQGSSSVVTREDPPPPPPRTLSEFIAAHYDLEWTTTKLHFFAGILSFAFGSGIRAWIAIGCPVVAKAALLLIVSATSLAISFLEEGGDGGDGSGRPFELVRLSARYFQMLCRKSLKNPWFGVSLALSLLTYGYMLMNVNHVYKYLVANSAP